MNLSNLQNRLTLVQYPAVVRNPDRMQQTLGGISRISEVFCTEKRLPLCFHPDNIYAKPTFGDRGEGSGLLLRVRIRRPRNPGREGAQSKVETRSLEIVGLVDTAYQFKNMCDFQFLPISSDPTTRKPVCIYNELVPSGVLSTGWLTAPTTAPYFLPPSTFSRLDTTTRLFRRESAKIKEDDSELIGRARVRFRKAAFYLSFSLTGPIPDSPPDGISLPDILLIKFISVEQINAVRDLFAKRPIMSKMYITWQTRIANEKLKYILPLLSYYYTTGPWRIMWVRYGYDPRKDFEARYMQQLDFRVRFHVCADNAVSSVDRKRNAFSGKRKRNPADYDYPYFEVDRMPRSRGCIIYQLCDVRVPQIQEMLDKLPTPMSGAVCNEKCGWLPGNFEEQCRTIMVDIVKQLAKRQRMERLAAEGVAEGEAEFGVETVMEEGAADEEESEEEEEEDEEEDDEDEDEEEEDEMGVEGVGESEPDAAQGVEM